LFVVLAMVLLKSLAVLVRVLATDFISANHRFVFFRCSLKPKNGAQDVRQDVYKHMILLIC
jgi:hypothetical protein